MLNRSNKIMLATTATVAITGLSALGASHFTSDNVSALTPLPQTATSAPGGAETQCDRTVVDSKGNNQCPQPAGSPVPKNTNYTPPPTQPDFGPQGIVADPVPPFSSIDGSVRNAWQHVEGDFEVQVYAGTDADGDGAVYVSYWRYRGTSTPPAHAGWYTFPLASHWVKITSAADSTLTVESDNGQTRNFDFTRGSWS